MKRFLNTLAWLLLFALLFDAFILRRNARENEQTIAEYQQQEQQHLAQIDSLYAALDASEATTDTIWVELIKWRTRYDTIIQNIPLMAPDAMLAEFDARTGPGDFSAMIDSLPPLALVQMPRIERALVAITQRDQLQGEVEILSRVISEKDGQITTLKAIIEQKDGIIKVRDAWIETIGNENETIRRQLTFHKIGIAALLVLLGVVAVR